MIELAMHGSAPRARKSLRGHSHVPARPGWFQVLLWRIFQPARYAVHVKPVQLGSSFTTLGYNTCPAKWRHQHLSIAADGAKTTHDVKDSK